MLRFVCYLFVNLSRETFIIFINNSDSILSLVRIDIFLKRFATIFVVTLKLHLLLLYLDFLTRTCEE